MPAKPMIICPHCHREIKLNIRDEDGQQIECQETCYLCGQPDPDASLTVMERVVCPSGIAMQKTEVRVHRRCKERYEREQARQACRK